MARADMLCFFGAAECRECFGSYLAMCLFRIASKPKIGLLSAEESQDRSPALDEAPRSIQRVSVFGRGVDSKGMMERGQ